MTTTSEDAPRRSLGATASRGAAVTFAGQGARILIQVVGIAVLARLLSPSDYGLLAVVLAITGIGEVIRDFGLSSAAVQARTLSPGQRTNLFWLNVGIGTALTAAFLGAAWPIAAAYGDDRLWGVTAALSSTFLLNGLATQFRADLNRSMRFTALTVTDIAAQLGGLLLTVAAALAGFGYWALVVQQLSSAVVQLVVVVASTRWRPGLPRRGEPIKQFVSFGSNLAAVQLLGYASKNVDSVVLAATVGSSALGLYNRAFQLMTLPLNQINAPSTRIALPVLSKLQDDPPRFAAFLRVGQTALLNVTSAALAVLAAQADAIVAISLGSQWEGAVPLFQLLSVAGFFATAGYASYWVFLAKGLTASSLRMALVTRPLMIVAILVGSRWGVTGVAAAYSLASVATWPISILWLRRVSDAPVGMMFGNGLRTLVVYGAGTAVSYLSTAFVPDLPAAVRLLIGVAALLAWLGVAALVSRQYRRDVRNLVSIRHHLRRSRRP